MTIDTQKLRFLVALDYEVPPSIYDAVQEAADHIDAQAAEIAEAKGQIERLDQQNNARRLALNALGAENARLRHALRWASAALQEACRRPTIITEKDRWRIGDETRTTGEILAAADAALSGESKC